MEGLVKGDIIVISYPFSDLTASKKRPSFVIATPKGDDIIICPITGEIKIDNYSILLENKDFKAGILNKISFVRADKLFTLDKSLIAYRIGSLKEQKIKEIESKIIEIITNTH